MRKFFDEIVVSRVMMMREKYRIVMFVGWEKKIFFCLS